MINLCWGQSLGLHECEPCTLPPELQSQLLASPPWISSAALLGKLKTMWWTGRVLLSKTWNLLNLVGKRSLSGWPGALPPLGMLSPLCLFSYESFTQNLYGFLTLFP